MSPSPISDLPSTSPLPVTVYSPESPLRNPLKLILTIFADIWRSRELIGMLFQRDLKAQYRQTYLGYIWILLPSIATTAAWYYMTNQGLINVGKTAIQYPAFVMIGQIIWGTFTAAFGAPQLGFNGGSAVFMKLKVPPEAFLANAVAKIIFDLVVKTVLIIAIFVLFWNELTLSWSVLLVPVGLLTTMLLGVSLGLFMVPIGSLYTDVGRIVTMVMPFLMYTTPVIFPLAKGDGLAATLMRWNPLSPLIEVTRCWLTQGAADPSQVFNLFILIPISLVIGIIGLVLLRIAMPHLVVRMGM
jgi:lipopolysaccharide transport system permease protein